MQSSRRREPCRRRRSVSVGAVWLQLIAGKEEECGGIGHGRSVGAMAEAAMKRSLICVPCSMCNHLIARGTCIHIASPLWESRPPATAIVTASSSIVAECCCRLSTSFSPFYPFNVHVLPSHRISWVVSENHRVHASHSHWTGIGVAGGSELVIQVISVCSVLLVLGMARSVPLSFLLM
jgi:hypothetical protein